MLCFVFSLPRPLARYAQSDLRIYVLKKVETLTFLVSERTCGKLPQITNIQLEFS